MSEPFLLIDILISKIHTPYISHLSIDHADLSVVTVVLYRRDKWPDLIRHLAVDTVFLKFLRIAVRQQVKCTHSVIHEPDFHTFRCFPLQDLKDRIPHDTFFYDEVLHENKLFRLFQFFYHGCEFGFSNRKIFGFGIPVSRKSQLMRQIIRQLRICRFTLPECICDLLILIHVRFRLHTQCRQAVLYKPCFQLQMHIDVKYRPDNRYCHHTQNP